jgi:hypothetical protein
MRVRASALLCLRGPPRESGEGESQRRDRTAYAALTGPLLRRVGDRIWSRRGAL